MIIEAGISKNAAKGFDAHYNLPVKYEKNFERAGFTGEKSIHNPKYASLLEKSSHRSNAYAYNNRWGEFFVYNTNPTQIQVIDYARQLANYYGYLVRY